MKKIFSVLLLCVTVVLASCEKDDDPVSVSGVTLNKETLMLKPGDKETLTAAIVPDDADDKAVTWGSSSDEIVTVSATGEVTAVKVGTATITVTSVSDKTKSKSCEVTVYTNNTLSFEEAPASTFISLGTEFFEVKVVRTIAYEAISVGVKLEDESGLFTLAAPTVSMEKDELETTVVIKYVPSALAIGTSYSLVLSFDEAYKAEAGTNTSTLNVMVKLEYEEYGTMSVDDGNFFPLLPKDKRDYKLFLAKYTTNCYKIEKFYGGDTDVEFEIEGGKVRFISPEYSYYNAEDVRDYPLYQVSTAMEHPSYGIMTVWFDSDPKENTCSALGEDGQLVLNSQISLHAWYTVSAGYFGWYRDDVKVAAVK